MRDELFLRFDLSDFSDFPHACRKKSGSKFGQQWLNIAHFQESSFGLGCQKGSKIGGFDIA